ncbi:MAG: CPBP family glutamic-type intramembrane protease [Patescibacteria group bacterium]
MEDFSRREFFKKFIPKPQEKVEIDPVQEKASIAGVCEMEGVKTEQRILSRRTFLKFVGAIGAAVAIEQMGSKRAEAQEASEDSKINDIKNQKTDTQSKSENISHEIQTSEAEQKSAEDSYTQTAIEQSLMMGAKYIANAIFEKLKIENGNKSLSDEEIIECLRDKPISSLFVTGVLAPVIEEAFLRALPSAFIDENDKKHRWDIGIPTSLLFALTHNFKKEESGELRFLKVVPINQFMGGLFYWYLMREKGYSHATMAHSINNAIKICIGMLLVRAYPEKKATEMVRKIWGLKKDEKISGKNAPQNSVKSSNPSEKD